MKPNPAPQETPPSTAKEDGSRCQLCGSPRISLYYRLKDLRVMRCLDCRLVFLPGSLDSKTLKDMYGEAYFTERGEYFLEEASTLSGTDAPGPGIQNFKAGLDLIEQYGRKGSLLDVGCALGAFLTLARDAGWKTYGVDISEYAASYCRDVLGHDAKGGELEEIGFPEQSFDVVTMWDLIEHLRHPVMQLREVNRILKDGGIVFVDTPNERSFLRALARAAYLLTGGMFKYPAGKLYHGFHLFYFTRATLRNVFEQSGFELIHVESRAIPETKGRARGIERLAVDLVSVPERIFDNGYELVAIARKVRPVAPAG